MNWSIVFIYWIMSGLLAQIVLIFSKKLGVSNTKRKFFFHDNLTLMSHTYTKNSIRFLPLVAGIHDLCKQPSVFDWKRALSEWVIWGGFIYFYVNSISLFYQILYLACILLLLILIIIETSYHSISWGVTFLFYFFMMLNNIIEHHTKLSYVLQATLCIFLIFNTFWIFLPHYAFKQILNKTLLTSSFSHWLMFDELLILISITLILMFVHAYISEGWHRLHRVPVSPLLGVSYLVCILV